MKKLTLCLFAAGFLIACSKKENTISGNPNANSLSIAAKEKPTGPNSSYVRNGPSKGWCNGWPQDCTVLPEVIITASAKVIIDSYCDNSNPNRVTAAFSDPDEGIVDILSEIPQAYEDSLLSNHYYMTQGNITGTKVSYIFGRTYPVTDSNADFAIQAEYLTE
ncbi:MAG: hypothetical protein ACJ76F_01615 [Bacteroidia bacterium]